MPTPEAMEPYTTKVMLGGIMTPMAPALAMSAAEKLGLQFKLMINEQQLI